MTKASDREKGFIVLMHLDRVAWQKAASMVVGARS